MSAPIICKACGTRTRGAGGDACRWPCSLVGLLIRTDNRARFWSRRWPQHRRWKP